MTDSLSYRFGQSVRHKKRGIGQFIRSTPTHATVQFPYSWRASVVPIDSIEPVEQVSEIASPASDPGPEPWARAAWEADLPTSPGSSSEEGQP